jgi:hypothetical protein
VVVCVAVDRLNRRRGSKNTVLARVTILCAFSGGCTGTALGGRCGACGASGVEGGGLRWVAGGLRWGSGVAVEEDWDVVAVALSVRGADDEEDPIGTDPEGDSVAGGESWIRGEFGRESCVAGGSVGNGVAGCRGA